MIALAPAVAARVHRVLEPLCRWFAIFGGAILVAVMVVTVASVIGRALIAAGLRPVPGDFELVEAGTALAIFAFLPWCQLQRGHITVDVLMRVLGPRADAWLGVVASALMTAAAALIAWRLALGLADMLKYGETSFILQFPVWWGYAACMVPAVLFVVVAAFTTWVSLNEALAGTAPPATSPTGASGP